MGAKPLPIWFEKIYRFIRIYDGIRYLVLFTPEIYNAIYDRINYVKSEKTGITYSINHNFARIRIDPYNSIKSVVNKNENNYYYNIFLEKGF